MTIPSTGALPPLFNRNAFDVQRPSPSPFQGLAVSFSGLAAQRLRMEVAAANLANADTTRTADGGPYQRRVVTMEADTTYGPAPLEQGDYAPMPGGVRVTGIAVDTGTQGARVYNPTHQDADADGFVSYPNVDVTQELVTLMEAEKLYKANLAAFDVTKAMLRRAIDL